MEIEIYKRLYDSFDDLLDWSLDEVRMPLKKKISREEWEVIQSNQLEIILKKYNLNVTLYETTTKTI